MRVYTWAVALVGWGLLLPLLYLAPVPPLLLFGLLGLLAIIAEGLMVPLPRGGYQSAGLAVAAVALSNVGPVYTALVMSVGVAVGNGLVHRRPLLTTVFNSGQAILSALLAGVVFVVLHREPGGLFTPLFTGRADPPFLWSFFAAVLAYILVSSLLVSGRVAMRRRMGFADVLTANVGWELLISLAFAAFGLLPALVQMDGLPPAVLLFSAPLLIVPYILMLHTSREHAHRELQVMERIGRALMTLDLEQLFQTMYEQVRQIISADAFYVALYDAQRDLLSFEFLVDSGERFPRQTREVTPTIREVLHTRVPIRRNLSPKELARDDPLGQAGQTEQRSTSLLYVPIATGTQVIGLLSVRSHAFVGYSERDQQLLAAIATQAATAIENARLFAASHRNVERLTTLQRISSVIASNLEMDKVLEAIVESSRQVLDVDRCAIYLGTEQAGVITDVYAHGLSATSIEAIKGGFGAAAGGILFKTRQPLIIEDAQTDPRMEALREVVTQEGFRTIALLPLLYHGELVGALAYYHDRVRPYSADDVLLAQAIADEAAIAVTTATLLAQTRRRAAETDLLNRIMRVLTETLDFTEISRRIVEELAATLGYSHVSIRHRVGEFLILQAQVGYAHPQETLHISKGVVGRVARTGKPVLLADVTKDRDYIAADPVVTSEAAVPITIDERVLGVMNVESDAGRPLSEADLELLLSVARQLSAALRNTTLYDEARRARDELRALYEAAKAISTSLELQAVLDSLVQVTCQAFGYEYGAILLVDDHTGDLVVEATYGYPLPVRGFRISPGKGVTGSVQRTGKSAIVPDVREEPRYVSFNEGILSEIAVPLIIEGKVAGVFNVESPRPRAFGEHDVGVLTALAGYATIAIENARLFEQTKRLAITDGLTELYNHRYLHEAMERTLDRCNRDQQPLALIMLEIDNFKRYNDTYGHRRGDEVLRIVADLLRKSSRPSDLVARYGGDEFMVVLPNTAKEAAHEIAERIRRTVEAYPFLLGESIVTSVTLSVGVAATPADGTTIDAIVDAVDRAQYTAKRSGGNKVHAAQALR